MCEKYIQDGKVAILVSRGFGAGWSTWEGKELAYDKRVVEFWLSHKDDEEYLRQLDAYEKNEIKRNASKLFKSWGYNDVYFGGFADIELVWIPVGTPFVITEYDGAESIETISSIKWTTV